MSGNKFIEDIIIPLTKIFEPLQEIKSIEAVSALLSNFGWPMTIDGSNLDNIINLLDFSQYIDEIQEIIEAIKSNENEELILNLVDLVNDLFDKVNKISSFSSRPSLYPFDQNIFWETFPIELLDYLIITFFENHISYLNGVFRILGIFTTKEVDSDPNRFPYEKMKIHWDRIPKSFSDFSGLLNTVYNWNSSDEQLDYSLLMENFVYFWKGLGINTKLIPSSDDLIDKFYDLDAPIRYLPQLRSKFTSSIEITDTSTNLIYVDLISLPIPPKNNRKGYPYGIMYGIGAEGITETEVNLSESFKLVIKGNFKSEGDIRLEIRPNNVKIVVDTDELTDIDLSFSLIYNKGQPIILLGSPKFTRLELEEAKLILSSKGSIISPSLNVEMGIKGGKLVIQGGDGDGFINKVLPKNPLIIAFDVIFGYSESKGFYIKGGAGFEYTIMINKSLGPIFINSVDLGFGVFDKDLTLITTITGGVEIGPVSATIGKIGLKTIIELGKPGILGKADLSLDFKPPSLISLGIDASAVKGWGFLEIDSPNYAGGLGLTIVDKISVAAFVLLTTRLPDNMPGFSLLMSLMAEFSPAIQLSFGFALKGVGGIIGIHRTMSEDALREVVKNHSLDAILFPKNPAKDAAKIITALRSVFPPCENHFVFGPMIKIIWGGPKDILEFSGGIFIEFGGPIRIAILGLAHAALPDEKAPVVVLNIDVLGFIDFGKKTLAIDASIFDSSILKKFNL